jgi:protein gp37
MVKRLQKMKKRPYTAHKYRNGFEFTVHPEEFETPIKWKKPSLIFVNSMSDTFHENAPIKFIKTIFEIMRRCPQHTFQILTKRPGIASSIITTHTPDNAWIGTTVCNKSELWKINELTHIDTPVRFVSFEPLLEDVGTIDLAGIDWVIVGCESGPGARFMNTDWVRSIRDQCIASDVPFMFKQKMIDNKIYDAPFLDGRTWEQFPKGWNK